MESESWAEARCDLLPFTEWDYGELLIETGDHDLKAYSTKV